MKIEFETRRGRVIAVDDVNFGVAKGEIFGLAGESGCGKTTTAHSILKLLPPAGRVIDGELLFDGTDILELSEKEMRQIRWREISIVFQGAMNSLNPVERVGDQILEAILVHEDVPRNEAQQRVEKLFASVGIDSSRMSSYPFELSGGMRQRVIIAMAIACEPKLVIADEPITALDVMVQAQILKLLKTLRKEMGLSMIFITHDLPVMAGLCDRIGIMYAGKLVEIADVETMFREPLHPYSSALISSILTIGAKRGVASSIPGNPLSLYTPFLGCRFAPRCTHANATCRKSPHPNMVQVSKGHYVSCHMCGT